MSGSWRDNCSNTLEEQLYMLENEIDTDCCIIVRDPNDKNIAETLLVHKYILCRASPVFEVMLNGNYSESKDKMIEIYDVKADVLKYLLRFLYGEVLPNAYTVENIIDLVIAADKYGIVRLVKQCNSILKQKFIKPEYIWRVNKLCNIGVSALIFEEIEGCVLKLLDLQTKQCLAAKDALDNCCEDDLIKITQMDNLTLDSELELIDFVNNWASHQLNKNNKEINYLHLREIIMPNIIQSLRFLTLNVEEYRKGPGTYIWLNPEEKLAILEYITSKNLNNLPKYINKNIKKRNTIRTLLIGNHFCPSDQQNNPGVISSLVIYVKGIILIHGIQLYSQTKCYPYTSDMSIPRETYSESITVGLSKLKLIPTDDHSNQYDKELTILHTFKGIVPYNSLIDIDFKAPYQCGDYIGHDIPRYIEVIGNKQAIYQNENTFFLSSNKREIRIDNDSPLSVKCYSKLGQFKSINPNAIHRIKYSVIYDDDE